MKKLVVQLVLLFSVISIAGCSNQEATQSSSTEMTAKSEQEISATISLKQEDDVLEEKNINVPTGSTLMEAMKENFLIEEENGMITAISEIAQDTTDNWYWTYTINDEMVNTGANDTILEDGDQVVFTYSKL